MTDKEYVPREQLDAALRALRDAQKAIDLKDGMLEWYSERSEIAVDDPKVGGTDE